jgi:hypothetical protein
MKGRIPEKGSDRSGKEICRKRMKKEKRNDKESK